MTKLLALYHWIVVHPGESVAILVVLFATLYICAAVIYAIRKEWCSLDGTHNV